MKDFEYFVKRKIVKKQSPDTPRAEFLDLEARKTFNFLLEKIEKLSVSDENANDYVKSCYDIIMELLRSKMLLQGYKSSGHGAHEAEVAFMKKISFSEQEVEFADQLRYFRNGMLYYGTIVDKEYAGKVIRFTKKFYRKIKDRKAL